MSVTGAGAALATAACEAAVVVAGADGDAVEDPHAVASIRLPRANAPIFVRIDVLLQMTCFVLPDR
ncbi:MAG TPA: hypothetical protein VIK65_01610 [Candidatus Limnocylindrales bacterium]